MDLVLAILGILAAGVTIVAFFMFGQAALETIAAVFRMIGHFFVSILSVGASSILALSWYAIVVLVFVVAGGGWLAYTYWFKPGNMNAILNHVPVCAELFDRNGELLDYLCPSHRALHGGYRIWRPIDAIDSKLSNLVIMLEDDKFYEHGGLDVDEIINSIEKDLATKKLKRGASTITQQLAKNLFLNKEKSFVRKALEVPLAFRLEKEFDKDKILELYLNMIEWGPGVYGAEAASRLYFDHEAAHLTDEEAWLLAIMIPNPKELNLWLEPKSKKSIVNRAKHLSHRLHMEHRLTQEQAETIFSRFIEFADRLESKRPIRTRSGRHYPVRWNANNPFTLGEIVSLRRKANEYLGGLNPKKQVHSFLDRKIQERIESLVDGTLHATEMGYVLAFLDGEQIRALAPLADKDKIPTALLGFATSHGLKVEVIAARKIPPDKLWP